MAESDASVVVSPPPLPGSGGASVSALIDAAADTNDVDVCEVEGAAPHKEKPFVVVARAMQVCGARGWHASSLSLVARG